MSNPSVAGPDVSGQSQDDKGPALLGFIVGLTSVAALAVGLRLSIRLWIVKGPGRDDISIVVALLLAIVIAIAYGLAIEHDYGRHIQFITKDDLAQSIKWNLVATVTFILSLVFSKMSVCFLFLRIVGSTCSRVKYAFLYGMMALAITVGSLNAFYTAGQCRPITKDWDHDIPGKCHGDISVDIGMAQGATNALIDFALALFPFTFLLKSNMAFRRKATNLGLMFCGAIAGLCSIARVIVSYLLVNSGDFTFVETAGTYLAIAEETASIVIVCVPTWLPLVRIIKRQRKERKKSNKWDRGSSERTLVNSSSNMSWVPLKDQHQTNTIPVPESAYVKAVPRPVGQSARGKLEEYFGSDADLVLDAEKA